MEEYVTNPETGRYIKVNCPTYQKIKHKYNLQKAEKIHKLPPRQRQPSQPISATQFNKMKQMKVTQINIDAASKQVTQPYLIRRSNTYQTGDKRGQSTRGWALVAPHRGRERHLLKQNCGDKCFLLPKTEAFPICPKCQASKCICQISCQGLAAAKRRAHQHKYVDLYDTIDQLYQNKCHQT